MKLEPCQVTMASHSLNNDLLE